MIFIYFYSVQDGQPSRRRSRLSSVCDEGWDSPLYESLEEIHVLCEDTYSPLLLPSL